MLPLLISSALFGTTSLILAIVVFIFARSKANRLWALFNFFIAWWGYGLVMVCLSRNDEATAQFWWKLATYGGLYLSVVFVHFAMEFTGSRNKRALIFLYIQASVIEILYLSKLLNYKLAYLYGSFYYPMAVDATYHIVTLSCTAPSI